AAIVDGEALARGVAARRGDALRRRVEPADLRPQARQRLADEPAAAADIDDLEALERPPPATRETQMAGPLRPPGGKAHRGDLVQWAELSLLVPPVLGVPREARDLGVVERSLGRGR